MKLLLHKMWFDLRDAILSVAFWILMLGLQTVLALVLFHQRLEGALASSSYFLAAWVVLFVAAMVLVDRVFALDPLQDPNAFWTTRPLRPRSLLWSKCLLLFALLLIGLLVARLTALSLMNGSPWSLGRPAVTVFWVALVIVLMGLRRWGHPSNARSWLWLLLSAGLGYVGIVVIYGIMDPELHRSADEILLRPSQGWYRWWLKWPGLLLVGISMTAGLYWTAVHRRSGAWKYVFLTTVLLGLAGEANWWKLESRPPEIKQAEAAAERKAEMQQAQPTLRTRENPAEIATAAIELHESVHLSLRPRRADKSGKMPPPYLDATISADRWPLDFTTICKGDFVEKVDFETALRPSVIAKMSSEEHPHDAILFYLPRPKDFLGTLCERLVLTWPYEPQKSDFAWIRLRPDSGVGNPPINQLPENGPWDFELTLHYEGYRFADESVSFPWLSNLETFRGCSYNPCFGRLVGADTSVLPPLGDWGYVIFDRQQVISSCSHALHQDHPPAPSWLPIVGVFQSTAFADQFRGHLDNQAKDAQHWQGRLLHIPLSARSKVVVRGNFDFSSLPSAP